MTSPPRVRGITGGGHVAAGCVPSAWRDRDARPQDRCCRAGPLLSASPSTSRCLAAALPHCRSVTVPQTVPPCCLAVVGRVAALCHSASLPRCRAAPGPPALPLHHRPAAAALSLPGPGFSPSLPRCYFSQVLSLTFYVCPSPSLILRSNLGASQLRALETIRKFALGRTRTALATGAGYTRKCQLCRQLQLVGVLYV